MIYAGRDGNPEIAAMADLLDEQRLAGATALARTLMDRLGSSDADLLEEVRDALWVLMSLEWYEAFVTKRGWSIERYCDVAARGDGDPVAAQRPSQGAVT